jgi:hypothetical protein
MAKGKGIPYKPETKTSNAHIEQVFYQDACRVFLANRATFQESEAALHKEDHCCTG